MIQLITAIFLPMIFFGGLCFLVGNAIPALVGGGICLLVTVLSVIIITRAGRLPTDQGMALGLGLLVTLPAGLNTLMLLLGGGIYYLAR